MSTEYTLIKDDLVILESSTKLKLLADDCINERYIDLTDYINPEDLMKIFLKGIKVCSYYMSSRDFKKTLSTLEDYSYD